MTEKKTTALLLCGGVGQRMGGAVPKQYQKIGGQMLLTYSLETLFAHPAIDWVQIAAAQEWWELIKKEMDRLPLDMKKWRGFSQPGKNRQLSIFNGLRKMKSYASENSLVLIHDGARPLVKAEQITRCILSMKGKDGVMPVLPMKDTVYLSADGRNVQSLLERRTVYAGQAPELFIFGKYLHANMNLGERKLLQINGSTEVAILDGLEIGMIPGDEENFKITTQEDFEHFRFILSARKEKNEGISTV